MLLPFVDHHQLGVTQSKQCTFRVLFCLVGQTSLHNSLQRFAHTQSRILQQQFLAPLWEDRHLCEAFAMRGLTPCLGTRLQTGSWML